ncbi:hypothetical protein PG994_004378 [Apiospora phragmitis]|uniref:Uncharacterized protein n=1 Tax=Apiospora phragmitis TaxID=2905665 RepID=A0ABR1VQF1_9PEZI
MPATLKLLSNDCCSHGNHMLHLEGNILGDPAPTSATECGNTLPHPAQLPKGNNDGGDKGKHRVLVVVVVAAAAIILLLTRRDHDSPHLAAWGHHPPPATRRDAGFPGSIRMQACIVRCIDQEPMTMIRPGDPDDRGAPTPRPPKEKRGYMAYRGLAPGPAQLLDPTYLYRNGGGNSHSDNDQGGRFESDATRFLVDFK